MAGTEGEPLEVVAGAWQLVLACPDVVGETVLVPGGRVRVKAGATARPKVKAEAAALKVDARRAGERAPVRVELRLPEVDVAVGEIEAHRSAWVGKGDWTFRVRLDDEAGTPAATDVRVKRWKKGRALNVVEADLSDATVRVRALLFGKPAEAAVEATRLADGYSTPMLDARAPLSLPPGRHRLTIKLAEAADFATEVEEIEVRPGESKTVNAKFTGGWLDVALTRDGAPLKVAVQLARPGAGRAFNYVQAPGKVLLAPGDYRLWVEGEAAGPSGKIELENARVRLKKTTEVRADLSMGEVRAEVEGVSDYRSLELRAAGGGAPVPAHGVGSFRVWPGRYELVLTLLDGAERIDGPFEVGLAETVTRAIEVERIRVRFEVADARALVAGGQVDIYRSGAAEPLATAKTGEEVPLSPGTYDLKARSGDGRSQWERGRRLRGGETVRILLPSAPKPPPDDLPEGDELPEGDDFEDY